MRSDGHKEQHPDMTHECHSGNKRAHVIALLRCIGYADSLPNAIHGCLGEVCVAFVVVYPCYLHQRTKCRDTSTNENSI